MDTLNSTSTPGATYTPSASPLFNPVPERRRKPVVLIVILSALAVLICFGLYRAGMSIVSGTKASAVEIKRFHDLYNREAWDEILASADPGFGESSDKEELIKFFSAVHRKLGSALKSSQTDVNVTTNPRGTFVRVAFSTEFQRATGTETVTWRKQGEALKLYGYTIASNKLVTD